MIINDRDYKTLLDAQSIVRHLRIERLVRAEALDADTVLEALMAAIAAKEPKGETVVAPY